MGSVSRVSIPGWYPDPAGQPNRFRYWFGEQWSEVTTEDPYLPPPPPPGAKPPPQQEPPTERPHEPSQPERPEQPEQLEQPLAGWGLGPDWVSMPDAPAGGDGGGRKGLIALLAVILALLLIGAGVGGWLLTRGGDGGDRSGSSRSEEPSAPQDPSATDDPSGRGTSPLSSCPPGDPVGPNRIRAGRVAGGGLSFAAPKGYRPASLGNKSGFGWLSGLSGVERVTESVPELGSGWVSMLVAGAVEEEGYRGPEQAALGIAGCMASSPDMYRSHVADRQLSSEGTEVDGHEAWVVHHEVRVEDDVLRTEGDHVVVIVVDLGDDEERSGVFTGFVPLGDEELLDRLDRAVGTLRVE